MKNLFLLLSALSCVATASADEWLDVTRYVTNPHYTGNSSEGWDFLSRESQSANLGYECQEVFSGTFNMGQTITGLTNGTYRVSVKGFYRNGNYSATQYKAYKEGTDVRTAYLYANTSDTLLQSIYAENEKYGYPGCVTVTSGTWGQASYTNWGTIPNNMESASRYFADGHYLNQLEVEVTDGTLALGIRNKTYVGGNWCIFTDWQLEYYSKPVYLSALSFAEESISIGKWDTYVLNPVFIPELSVNLKCDLQWSSSNPSVVSVDENGVLTAHELGTSVVTVKDALSGLTASVNVAIEMVEMSVSNVVVNEIQVCNVDGFIDPSFNYGGWVELYNPTSKSVNLGNAYVSDAKGHSFRLPENFGSIPGFGFRNLWFDHNSIYGKARQQVPFKLNRDGGTIIISNDRNQEIVRQDYPAALSRISYARTTDGGGQWSMTGDATPQKSNSGSKQWGETQVDAPVVSHDGQFFTEKLNVQVQLPSGCTLVYTTDGSVPTLTNGYSYSNTTSTAFPFTLSTTQTATYRFRLYQDGKLPSEVVTRSYINDNRNFCMPVVSVVCQKEDLFGAEYGVYVKGSGNGRPGNGQADPCNWNMDWERAVNFEYMVPDANGNYSSTAFSQLVDFEMCGGWSRAWEPHSFKLKANKAYGAGNLDYTFFDDKPYNRNKSLQLRNGGNDNGSRLKDAALQEIVRRSGFYVDCQAWQPVHVFINGTYRKVLNMREPNNKQFAFANYGIDSDYIDQFEMSPDSGYVQKSGTKDAFDLWYKLSKTCGQSAEDYRYICDSLVDIDEYVNYMAVEFFLSAGDWPQNNVKGFRAYRDDDNGHPTGKFHFVLFDLDGTFANNYPFYYFAWKENYTFDSLYGIDADGNDLTGQRFTEEIEFVTIFLNMLSNENFRKRFVDAYCLVAGSVFDPTFARTVVNSVSAVENSALAVEGGSSSGTASNLISNLSVSRQSTMLSHLQDYFGLNGGRTVSLSANVEGARLLMNGQEVPRSAFNGTLFGDVELQAVAPAGYRFAGWNSEASSYEEFEIFGENSYWYYDCSGSMGSYWMYDVPSNTSGKAPLGYGKSVNTTLTSNKLAYYFGKKVNLTAAQIQQDLVLDYVVDDGFVIYVNGNEVTRYNMPSGTVTSETAAYTYAEGNPDSGKITLPKRYFRAGENLICVEVHNNDASSSDIYWSAVLKYRKAVSAGTVVLSDSILTLKAGEKATLEACFEPLSGSDAVKALGYPVKVNEVGASNDVYVNEYWKKNDWIELYNNSNQSIDVAGLYVSDNAEKPAKYQIQGSFAEQTVIPAGGHLVVWADKLALGDQLHTGFKLSNNDESVVLILSSAEFESNNADYFDAHPEMKGYADVLVYDGHEYDQSVGRYPDGGNAIFRMNRPTIGKENHHTTMDQLLGFDQGITIPEELRPNGIDEIVEDREMAASEGDGSARRNVVYYDLMGRRVSKPKAGQLVLGVSHPKK